MTEKSMVLYQSSKLLLPSSIKTLSGAIIDPHLTFWSFHDGLNKISLNFARLRKFATEEFVSSSKFALIWYAENTEGVTLARNFEDLRRLLQSLAQTIGQQVSVIDVPLLASYRASLNSETEWRLGCLRAFLIRWNELGVSGITDSAVRFLKSIRLKGMRKGTAVLTMNPHTGPLTDVERSAVQAALSDAFSEGKVTLSDYLLAWLSLLLGQRTV